MDFGDTVTVGGCGISPSGNLSNLVVKKAYINLLYLTVLTTKN